MDNLPDDIYKIILEFISVRERESLRLVSSTMRRNINFIKIIEEKISKKIGMYRCIETWRDFDMMNVKDSYYIKKERLHVPHSINPLFRRNQNINTCVKDNCREKMMGSVYTKLSIVLYDDNKYVYIKSPMPYCMSCFSCGFKPF